MSEGMQQTPKKPWQPLDEIKNYCRVATAIIKTVEIQKELEDIYLEAEKCLA